MRIKMLGGAVSSPLEPLKQAAEIGFEASLESGETRKFFPIIMSYCCKTPERKGMCSVLHGAGRQQLCVRSHRHVTEYGD